MDNYSLHSRGNQSSALSRHRHSMIEKDILGSIPLKSKFAQKQLKKLEMDNLEYSEGPF